MLHRSASVYLQWVASAVVMELQVICMECLWLLQEQLVVVVLWVQQV